MAEGDKLTGTFVGTFTGTFTAADAPAPSPAPSPAPVPTPAPPAVQAESPNGTTMPPAPAIFDSTGARWSVVGGAIRRNGADTISSNVKLMLYHNGTVYQNNEAGGWWKWQSDKWVDAFDPRVSTSTPAPSPAPGPTPAPAPSTGMPVIEDVVRHPADMLEIDKYWIIDNRWGKAGINEGTASYDFMQAINRLDTVSANGGIACRIKWKWPEFNQQGQKINDNPAYSEVKGYPGIIYGPAPGHSGPDQWPAWEYAVRAPDGVVVQTPPDNAPPTVKNGWQPKGGSVIRRVPCGAAPGHALPKRLNSMAPGSLVADMKWKNRSSLRIQQRVAHARDHDSNGQLGPLRAASEWAQSWVV